MSAWPRVIAHADMDAFYAAVEQHDDPSLRGLPVLVGPPSGRGVVLTASYEARPFGVGSALPMAVARRRCPRAVIVPPRFSRYTEVSQAIMRVFSDFSPDVEPISLDEAFLDMTGAAYQFGRPRTLGARLKDAVRRATGLTVSVGISGTKYVAKVASDLRKPDGLTVVPPDRARAFLAPLPVSRLWGAGPKTAARIEALGLHTIGDVAAADPAFLRRGLGRAGTHFHRLAHARDPRPVARRRVAGSVGSDRTLPVDVRGRERIARHLRRAADSIGRRLRRRRVLAGGVRVKLKTRSFRLMTRQRRLPAATDVAERLYDEALPLLELFDHAEPFRLVGLAAYALTAPDDPEQLELFAPAAARRRRLEGALDDIRRRFGSAAAGRAEDLEHGLGLAMAPNLDFLEDGDGADA